MKHHQYFALVAGLLFALALTWGLAQEGSGGPAEGAELGAQIAQQGTPGGAAPCMACHGAEGAGIQGTPFPRLAGLDFQYIVKQLRDFQEGNRTDPTMTPMAMGLQPNEVEAVAAYFSQQSPPPLPTDQDAAQVAAGRLIAERGIWDMYVPACSSCHGPAGAGVGHTFPALAGQNAAYTVKQFENWRTDARHNDALGMMQAVVDRMNDEQIAAVAAYYQSLGAAGTGSE